MLKTLNSSLARNSLVTIRAARLVRLNSTQQNKLTTQEVKSEPAPQASDESAHATNQTPTTSKHSALNIIS